MKKERDLNIFSLSFLDCISCGFGAVLLLFVITLGSGPDVTSAAGSPPADPKAVVELLSQITADESALAEVTAEVDALLERISQAQMEQQTVTAQIKTEEEEKAAREKAPTLPEAQPNLPIGIPVADNHLIFIIDTSGSMRDPRNGVLWSFVIEKGIETLNAYPIVKKIQILDADGRTLLSGTRGRWLADSPSTRETIKRALRTYPKYSESNPVPGILRAIKDYGLPREADKKVGLYVFGDEFTQNAGKVLDRIDAANPADSAGKRLVTINAVGFPHVVKNERHTTQTGLKFANLMRELTYRHGGAFVGMEQ